jgi:hypothetical protein
LLDVADSAPSVRPWNDPRNAMRLNRLLVYRASLIAASIASAPELLKNDRTHLAAADRDDRRHLFGQRDLRLVVEVRADMCRNFCAWS